MSTLKIHESSQPILPVLPGSVNEILQTSPGMSPKEAVSTQAEQLDRYRSAAATVLGISTEDLHEMSPTDVAEQLGSVERAPEV